MQREAKFIGWFVLVMSFAAVVAGAGILIGGPLPTSGLSCKALCGLTLLAAEVFGDFAGAFVGGLLWLTVGAAGCLFGYRLLKA